MTGRKETLPFINYLEVSLARKGNGYFPAKKSLGDSSVADLKTESLLALVTSPEALGTMANHVA